MRPAALLLVLAACGRPEPWTVEGAAGPVLRAIDGDGDGAVNEAEWEAVSYSGPTFSEIDMDRDGEVSLAELLQATWRQDPLTFDDPPVRVAPGNQLQSDYFPTPWSVRTLRDALLFAEAEVLAADPQAVVPDADTIVEAAWSGSADSPEVRAVRESLRSAYTRARLETPSLLEAASPGGSP